MVAYFQGAMAWCPLLRTECVVWLRNFEFRVSSRGSPPERPCADFRFEFALFLKFSEVSF